MSKRHVLPEVAYPAQLMSTGVQLFMLGLEAQMVILYRMLGMGGLWAVTSSENTRMVNEKPAAFAASASAAVQAAASGRRPDEVVNAAVKPLRRATSSNFRRLSKRGPKALL